VNMSTIWGHVARRGMEAHAHVSHRISHSSNDLPKWGIVLLVATLVSFVAGSVIIEYAFNTLVPALVMVESSQAIFYEPLEKSDDPDATLDSKIEEELILVKQEPITSSFRATIKHLRAVGGRGAYLRGIGISFATGILKGFTAVCISSLLPFLPFGTADVISAVLVANLAMTWTHIVISSPSAKPWFRRVPAFSEWKKVAGPTSVEAIAEQFCIIVPLALVSWMNVGHLTASQARDLMKHDKSIIAMRSLAVVATSIMMSLLIKIPAKVVLTRVQASLLPEEQETIVPFDRSFNGKVDEGSVVNLIDAWKTFTPSSRIRLLKTYVKTFFMQMALLLFFVGLIFSEFVLMIGVHNLKKMVQYQNPTVDEVRVLPIEQ